MELLAAAAEAKAMGLSLFYSLPLPEAQATCLENPARSLYVDAEGNLAPCIYVNLPTTVEDPLRRVYGSCMTENPFSVWQGPGFSAFRDALASGDPDAPCRNCPKRFASGNRAE